MIREEIVSVSKPHLFMQITQARNMATVRKDVRNVTQETWVSQAVLLSSCETLGRSLPIPGFFVKVKYTGIGTLPLAVRIKCVEMLGKLQNTL